VRYISFALYVFVSWTAAHVVVKERCDVNLRI